MFKNLLSLFLLVFLFIVGGKTYATVDPNLTEKNNTETDSLSVSENKKNTAITKELSTRPNTTKPESSTTSFWQQEEEVEEDSTSNSALSFNFIYYVIEKFKFQVE